MVLTDVELLKNTWQIYSINVENESLDWNAQLLITSLEDQLW